MYNAHQQRMRYLVEFTVPSEDTAPSEGGEPEREEARSETDTDNRDTNEQREDEEITNNDGKRNAFSTK